MSAKKYNKITHFYLRPEDISDNKCIFTREESDHILKVLRLYIGDTLLAASGESILYQVRLTAHENRILHGEILGSKNNVNELDYNLSIAFGLLPIKKCSELIDLGTQLGVDDFIPINSKHSVVKLSQEKVASRIIRLQSVALSAMKQSLRCHLPKVHAPVNIDELCELISEYDLSLLGSFTGEYLHSTNLSATTEKILILTGPEAGFSMIEEKKLIKAGAKAVNLGERRLRAELAPLILTSQYTALREQQNFKH